MVADLITCSVYYVRQNGQEKYFVYRAKSLFDYLDTLLTPQRAEHSPIEVGVKQVTCEEYIKAVQ